MISTFYQLYEVNYASFYVNFDYLPSETLYIYIYIVKPALNATCLEEPIAVKLHLSKVPMQVPFKLTCLERVKHHSVMVPGE